MVRKGRAQVKPDLGNSAGRDRKQEHRQVPRKRCGRCDNVGGRSSRTGQTSGHTVAFRQLIFSPSRAASAGGGGGGWTGCPWSSMHGIQARTRRPSAFHELSAVSTHGALGPSTAPQVGTGSEAALRRDARPVVSEKPQPVATAARDRSSLHPALPPVRGSPSSTTAAGGGRMEFPGASYDDNKNTARVIRGSRHICRYSGLSPPASRASLVHSTGFPPLHCS